jgi:hypothetical protein
MTISSSSTVLHGDSNGDVNNSGGIVCGTVSKVEKNPSVILCIMILGFESHSGHGYFYFTRMLYICGIVQCIRIGSETQHARIPDL